MADKISAPPGRVHSFTSYMFRGQGAKLVIGLASAPVCDTSAVARHRDSDEEHHDWKLFITEGERSFSYNAKMVKEKLVVENLI